MQTSIFLQCNWELSSSVLLGSHACKSSSWNLHNCNFTLQILLGSFYAWFSGQLLLGVEVFTNYLKHLTEKMQTIFETIITKKKKRQEILMVLMMRGLKVFVLFFFPPFVLLCSLRTAHAKHLWSQHSCRVRSPDQYCLLSILSSFL